VHIWYIDSLSETAKCENMKFSAHDLLQTPENGGTGIRYKDTCVGILSCGFIAVLSDYRLFSEKEISNEETVHSTDLSTNKNVDAGDWGGGGGTLPFSWRFKK
jgi:hypothetical protein